MAGEGSALSPQAMTTILSRNPPADALRLPDSQPCGVYLIVDSLTGEQYVGCAESEGVERAPVHQLLESPCKKPARAS